MQALPGEQTVSAAAVPPVEIQQLRGLFSTCRLCKKQTTQIKNRIHSLLKERLYGFTREEVFTQKQGKTIRAAEKGSAMPFQTNKLFDTLEYAEASVGSLKDKVMEHAEPFMKEIQILTGMKGISVFIAMATAAGIIKADRFRNSKAFAPYLRSAPRAANSNASVRIRGTNRKGRKLFSILIVQSLSHMPEASEKLNEWYGRLAQYKKAGSARSGLRRRIFAETYQMLKKGECHYGREAGKHEIKMRQYKDFLERRKTL